MRLPALYQFTLTYIVGALVLLAERLARWPGFWASDESFSFEVEAAFFWLGPFYELVPILCLATIARGRRNRLNLSICCTIALTWEVTVALFLDKWQVKWWLIERDFPRALAVRLAVGSVFWMMRDRAR
jgi:hypothetical protein